MFREASTQTNQGTECQGTPNPEARCSMQPLIRVSSKQNVDVALQLRQREKKIVSYTRNHNYTRTKMQRNVIGK